MLTKLRIDRARGLIAALGSDAENVYTILSARGLRPNLLVIARADSEDAERKLLQGGRDARHLALPDWRDPNRTDRAAAGRRRLRPAGDQLREPRAGNGAGQHRAPRRSWSDRSIVDANLRQRFGVIVVGIRRLDGRMEFNPPPDAVMRAGDQLVVLGPPELLKGLEIAAQ